jgi:hypothetical protein
VLTGSNNLSWLNHKTTPSTSTADTVRRVRYQRRNGVDIIQVLPLPLFSELELLQIHDSIDFLSAESSSLVHDKTTTRNLGDGLSLTWNTVLLKSRAELSNLKSDKPSCLGITWYHPAR